MRILFYSDTHLGYDFPIRPRLERRRRGAEFFAGFEQVLKYARENEIELLIHGGDFFYRSKVPQLVISKAYEMLFEFSENGIPTVIVPGNHGESWLPQSIFIKHPQIHVFEKPQTFHLERKGIQIAISGFPFVRHNIRDKFPNLVRQTEWDKQYDDIKLLCFHQAVEGAKVRNYTFRYGEEIIRQKDISDNFSCILSGHIHRKQILWLKREKRTIPLFYAGSTQPTSFREIGEKKGFWILDFHQFCNGWRLAKFDFITLPTRPMTEIVIEYNIKNEKQLRDFLKSKIQMLDQNAIVKLKYRNPQIMLLLKAEFLSDIFPKTMKFQVSNNYRQNSDRNLKLLL